MTEAPKITIQQIEADIVNEQYVVFGGRVTVAALTLENGFILIGQSAAAFRGNFDEAIGRDVARGNAIDQAWPLYGYALRDRLSREEAPVADTDQGWGTYPARRLLDDAEEARDWGLSRPYSIEADELLRLDRNDRQSALYQAVDLAKARPGIGNVVETAERFRAFLAGDVTPPASVEAAIMDEIKGKHPGHVERMIVEYRQLNQRWQKLGAFFATITFAQLDRDERDAMEEQRTIMGEYARVLLERLDRAGVGKDELLA